MDPGQQAELRQWAERLARESPHREARAAARAILLLTDEVERLEAELKARESVGEGAIPRPDEEADRPDEPPSPPPTATLGDRLRRALGSAGREEATDATTPPDPDEERRRQRELELRARRRRGLRRLVFALAVLGALAFATLSLGARIAAPSLHAQGPAGDAKVGPTGLKRLAFSIRSGRSRVAHAVWKLDGHDVSTNALVVGDTAVLRGSGLPDGEHKLTVHVSGGFPGSGRTHSWRFTIDTTPPTIGLPAQVSIEWGAPIRIAGALEPDATLSLNGHAVPVRAGRFSLTLRARPLGPVLLRARDGLGNASRKHIWISLVPRRPPAPIRAVHVTFYGWATSSLREPVLRLVDEHRIDAVELDLKDESGTIGWNAPIPLGKRVGAVRNIYDLAAAVELLHSKGIRVIGRLVAFRDPILASAAWKAGDRDEVIQTPDGGRYLGSGYGGFTNFANPVVRKYNVDVAVAAARIGVDEVLYDYVRRPDGPLSSMVFPGLKGSAEASVASFLAQARAALAPYKTFLGASVFGVAVTRPKEVAQDVSLIAQHVDYIAPMVYPSHWAPGEYGVANPNAEPYEIVARSLKDFAASVQGSGARIVPWLQDFSLGLTYGPNEVKAQIDAASADGVDEFLLWDPAVTYDGSALEPMTSKPARPAPAPEVKANELGLVPVLMYHQILSHGGGDYDLTPEQFRAELTRLWRDGYVPIQARDLETGNIDIPAGKSPVVLTFDDSDNNQVAFLANGRVKPETAVGILIDFARAHPGFVPTGTFFVLRDPFTGSGRPSNDTLRWLAGHGFELGTHTKDHTPLRTLADADVQRELVLGLQVIRAAVPRADVVSMSLPSGSYPRHAALAVSGSWKGRGYRFAGVFLVGANPAPSPFSTKFDAAKIPRIKTSPDSGVKDFGSTYWLDVLERDPALRYVSDGNPETVTFPSSEQGELAPRYRTRSRPY